MKMKKLLALALATTMVSATLFGCGNNSDDAKDTTKKEEEAKTDTKKEEKGSVYYLNFKPEVENVWNEVAKAYTDETGVPVKVVTAASGTYEQTLKSEIAKEEAPTLFQINGPVGYASWKDYCADLKDTDFYNALSDKSLAVTGEGDGVYGVPYTIEGYGIIYNKAIMDKYFKLDGAKAKSVDDITSYDKLKEVVEDMTAKKEDLGIKGVFASTSLLPGEDWRWQTHLANLPIYYEYKDKDVTDADKIDFKYSDNMNNIFDLYINNSCTEPTLLGSKTVADSMAEFAMGQAAMVQNGNWAWSQINEVEGNTVKEGDIAFLPIYTGVKGEENQGLCIGTENFFSINSQASEADQKASIDFVNWLINSEKGKDYMVNKLGNAAPFTTFKDDEKPSDPLAKSMLASMESGKESVAWSFTTFPSQTFKDDFGAALLEYANGNMKWDGVKELVVEKWAAEKEASSDAE